MALDLETAEAKAREIRHAFHECMEGTYNPEERRNLRKLRRLLEEAREMVRDHFDVGTFAGTGEPPKDPP